VITTAPVTNPVSSYIPHPDVTKPKAGNRIHKRMHKDGNESDPYTLMADGKPMGASKGEMPSSMKGMKKKPANHDTFVKQGWPDLNAPGRNGIGKQDFANFTDAKPVEYPPGKKLYRVVDEKAGNAGGYCKKKKKGSSRLFYNMKE